LALTSPTGGGRSVGIVLSRTKATEFFFIRVTSIMLTYQMQVTRINYQNVLHVPKHKPNVN